MTQSGEKQPKMTKKQPKRAKNSQYWVGKHQKSKKKQKKTDRTEKTGEKQELWVITQGSQKKAKNSQKQ